MDYLGFYILFSNKIIYCNKFEIFRVIYNKSKNIFPKCYWNVIMVKCLFFCFLYINIILADLCVILAEWTSELLNTNTSEGFNYIQDVIKILAYTETLALVIVMEHDLVKAT